MGGSKTHRILAAGAAVSLIVGVGVGTTSLAGARPAARGAALATGFSFQNISTLTSTTHRHLSVSVSGSDSKSGTTETNGMSVSISERGSAESHSYSFRLKTGSLHYDPAKGKGSISAGKQLNPYGIAALQFADKGKPSVNRCGTYRSFTQPVTVKGKFAFDTKTKGKHGWGKVGGSKSRKLGNGTVSYQTGSPQPCGHINIPCSKSVRWNAYDGSEVSDPVSFTGTIAKGGGSFLFASQSKELPKPSGALRSDTVSTKAKNATFSVSHGKAKVTIGPSGPISGSATLTATAAATKSTSSCGHDLSAHQPYYNWLAPYKNGKKPLTVHTIYGKLRVKNLTKSDAASGRSSISQYK